MRKQNRQLSIVEKMAGKQLRLLLFFVVPVLFLSGWLVLYGLLGSYKEEAETAIVNLENGKQSSNWFFNGMNFATPEVIATVHGNKYQLKNAAIRGNGVLTGKKFTPVGMVFSAQELTGGNCRIQYPVLDLTVRQTPTAAERCQTEFKCRNAQFPENRFNLRKCSFNGRLTGLFRRGRADEG